MFQSYRLIGKWIKVYYEDYKYIMFPVFFSRPLLLTTKTESGNNIHCKMRHYFFFCFEENKHHEKDPNSSSKSVDS